MLLEVKDIQVYYGAIHAIKGVSFEVNEGEIVTLIGANGAGKTTTLDTIAGLLRSRGGDIVFQGESIAHKAPHLIVKDGLALVPEGRRVFAQMTVEENLEMGAFTRANSTVEPGLEKVYELFPRLKERRRQVAGTLSGGEMKRIEIATVLAKEHTLCIFDEPEAGIDLWSFSMLIHKFEEIHKEKKQSLIVISHQEKIISMADRIMVIDDGKIKAEGLREDVLPCLNGLDKCHTCAGKAGVRA